MRISLPVLKRNAPNARSRSMTASIWSIFSRVGANVISSGSPPHAGRARCVRSGKRSPRPLSPIDLLAIGVEADLHATRGSRAAVQLSGRRSAVRWFDFQLYAGGVRASAC